MSTQAETTKNRAADNSEIIFRSPSFIKLKLKGVFAECRIGQLLAQPCETANADQLAASFKITGEKQ